MIFKKCGVLYIRNNNNEMDIITIDSINDGSNDNNSQKLQFFRF
jgi:hypothetical protein